MYSLRNRCCRKVVDVFRDGGQRISVRDVHDDNDNDNRFGKSVLRFLRHRHANSRAIRTSIIGTYGYVYLLFYCTFRR